MRLCQAKGIQKKCDRPTALSRSSASAMSSPPSSGPSPCLAPRPWRAPWRVGARWPSDPRPADAPGPRRRGASRLGPGLPLGRGRAWRITTAPGACARGVRIIPDQARPACGSGFPAHPTGKSTPPLARDNTAPGPSSLAKRPPPSPTPRLGRGGFVSRDTHGGGPIRGPRRRPFPKRFTGRWAKSSPTGRRTRTRPGVSADGGPGPSPGAPPASRRGRRQRREVPLPSSTSWASTPASTTRRRTSTGS